MKKAGIFSLILLLLCLSVCGCNHPVTEEENQITLYFVNSDHSKMVTELRPMPEGSTGEVLLRDTLKALLGGPQLQGNQAVIPEGTRINSLSIDGTTVQIDFSKEFSKATGVDELLCRFTVVNTICNLGDFHHVLLSVDGVPLKSAATGEELGPMSANDMVFSLSEETQTYATVKLYFANKDSLLSPEVREIQTKSSDLTEKNVLNELIKGPTDSGLRATIPAETKIISVETKENICYVNLSNTFTEKYTGLLEEQLKLYSIVNSLTELPGIEKVQFLIEGKKVDALHYIALLDPLERNSGMISD